MAKNNEHMFGARTLLTNLHLCVWVRRRLETTQHKQEKRREKNQTGNETTKTQLMGGAAISCGASTEPFYSIIIAILRESEAEISRRTVVECQKPAVLPSPPPSLPFCSPFPIYSNWNWYVHTHTDWFTYTEAGEKINVSRRCMVVRVMK